MGAGEFFNCSGINWLTRSMIIGTDFGSDLLLWHFSGCYQFIARLNQLSAQVILKCEEFTDIFWRLLSVSSTSSAAGWKEEEHININMEQDLCRTGCVKMTTFIMTLGFNLHCVWDQQKKLIFNSPPALAWIHAHKKMYAKHSTHKRATADDNSPPPCLFSSQATLDLLLFCEFLSICKRHSEIIQYQWQSVCGRVPWLNPPLCFILRLNHSLCLRSPTLLKLDLKNFYRAPSLTINLSLS